MAYADILPLNTVGAALRIDVSLDSFSTITYRYGSHGGLLDGTNEYDSYIKGVSAIGRGFGDGGIAGAGTLDIVLDNTNAQVDWLLDISEPNFYNITKAKFRVYSVIFDARTPTPTYLTKQLGDFYIVDMPKRNNSYVTMQLGDAVLGPLDQAISLPTLADWRDNAGETEDTCPFIPTTSVPRFVEGVDFSTQIPVAFGNEWVRAIPLGNTPAYNSDTSDFYQKGVAVVCVTANTGAVTAANISNLRLVGKKTGIVADVPKTATINGSTVTVWEVKKSAAITKNGVQYCILYVLFRAPSFGDAGFTLPSEMGADFTEAGDYYAGMGVTLADMDLKFADSFEFHVLGVPLSGVTDATNWPHGASVIQDIMTYYAPGSLSGSINASSFDAVRAATPATAGVCGVMGGHWPEQNVFGVGSLREVINRLCGSCDLDFFVNWSGQMSVSTEAFSFASYVAIVGGTTLERIDEERTFDVVEWIPSNGQRGSPFNRLWLSGGHGSKVLDRGRVLDAPSQGPYDDPTAMTNWGRPLERTVEVSWLPQMIVRGNPFWYRNLRNIPRTRVRFTTGIDGLRLDLGQLFYFNWTRNKGTDSPYTDTIFQVESINYNPVEHSVEIEAIWSDNMASEKPYLLDTEAFIILATGSGGRTVTIVDADATVTFSSGSLVTDGVQANDLLVLKDTTEGLTTFKRNRAIKIDSVTDATHLEVVATDLDFGTAAPTAYSGWEIRKSFLTYHTAITDPTNYPSGSTMYGKVCSTGDEYTGSVTANKLLNG